MRNFAALLILLPFLAGAQNTEGTIIYAETMDFGIEKRMERMKGRMEEMGGDEETMKMIRERLKAMQLSEKALYFNTKETLYKEYEDPNKPQVDANSGATMRMMKPKYNVYQDLEGKKSVNQQDFMGKLFLIRSSMDSIKWKLTGETDTVAGYLCHKATAMKDTLVVTAWFTPLIPVSAGPLGFGRLPGMIMKLDVEGQYQVTAVRVEFGAVAGGTIKPPDKGKEVTQEEYVAIVKQKMEEMREMYGEGGGMRMRMH